MESDLAQAINTLKSKKWVDLTHTFGPNSPHFATFDDAVFKTLFDHDDGFFAQNFSLSGQYGTHIDATIHFVSVERHVNELRLKEIILALIVIDKVEAVEKDPNFTISVEDVLVFEESNGKIEPYTFVALRTDWSQRWPNKEAFNNQDEEGNNQIPGWGIEA